MPPYLLNVAVSLPPLGRVRALLAFPKRTGREHRQIPVVSMTQQVVIVRDQGAVIMIVPP